MREVTNRKYIECPKCKSIHAEVKRNGLFAKIGIGGGLIASLVGSVTFSASVFSVLTFGLIGISVFIFPAIITFLIIFVPIVLIINYLAGYTIECNDCHSIYKISSKEFTETNLSKIHKDTEITNKYTEITNKDTEITNKYTEFTNKDTEITNIDLDSHDKAKAFSITVGIIIFIIIIFC
ncbi:hypothetical protein GNF68_14795 [Clostridium perfringens]|uniref:Uncharacterized protein n=1 Tax=Clostridium perfringens TaxID=1502 RepID=A0AAW9I8L5_CLOPF|nr:hypothetical protein [Clostridium perfringens]MDZ4910280.1 hypothetical protein [Clostridium perfringens]